MGQRLPSATEADVEDALASRAIVRPWPMRGTLHFVAAEDARWMLRLLASRAVAGSAGRCRQLELDAAAFARSRKLLARALRGGRSLTRRDAYAVLDRGRVSPAGQRGIHILGHLAQQGFLCFGPRRERQPTFVLLEDWLAPARDLPREEALAVLATRYFASHGPATVQDFAWWSGLRVKDAGAAIAEAGSRLLRDMRAGRSFHVAAAAPAGKWRRPAASLLPPWDEYLVAYRDREAALGHLPPRYMVVGMSLLIVDGRVRGSWGRALSSSTVKVTVDLWTSASRADRGAVEKAADRYARFLEKPVVLRTDGRTRP